MRRLLTGYAVSYNFRHRHHGHLFQNRYKSILCQEDSYIAELVRYIHLNPLRAGLVKDLRALNTYPYCGHRCILGKVGHDRQDVDYILKLFASSRPEAIRRYREYVKKAKEGFERKHRLQSEGISFEYVVNRVAELRKIAAEQVLARGKDKKTVTARSILCFWVTTELAISQVELAQKLKISQPAVSMAVRRGEQLISRNSYRLKD